MSSPEPFALASPDQRRAAARRDGGWRAAGRDRSLDVDATLRRDIEDRQPGALAEVYERHGGAMCDLARRLGGGEPSPGVVQDVLLRLWHQPDRFDPSGGSLRSHLMAETRRRALDVHAGVTSRRERERVLDAGVRRSPDGDTDRSGGWAGGGPWSTLARLPDVEREPIALTFLIGLPRSEAARRLAIPVGTVNARIRSGLRRLHVLLLEDERAAGDRTGGLSAS